MQRMRVAKIIAAVLICSAGCARQEKALMGYPKFRTRTLPGGTSREMPNLPLPRILPETHYAAGRVFEQQGAMQKAIEQYRKAVLLNHNYAAAYQRLGLALSITQQHDQALEAFAKAAALKPDNAVIRNNLGFELLYQERWSEAEQNLREAVRIKPGFVRAHINLGLLLGRTQRFDEALASFRTVLQEPDAYYNLGLLLRAQKRYEEAADAFRHVLAVNPKFSAATVQLAQIDEKNAAVKNESRNDTKSTAAAPALPVQPEVATVESEPLMTVDDSGSATFAPFGPPAVTMTTEAHPMAPGSVDPEGDAAHKDRSASLSEESPTPKVTRGWMLTLADIARSLEIVDNDRQCEKEEQIRLAEDRDAQIKAIQDALDEQGARTASMKLPGLATSERPNEVVLVLPAAETRETVETTEEPATGSGKIAPAFDESWEMMRELEASLQLIRNEIECRKSDAEAPNAAATKEEHPGINPAATIERGNETRGTENPASKSKQSEHSMNWDRSFGALDTILSVARNEDHCVAMERNANRFQRLSQDFAAPIPFVPRALISTNWFSVQSNPVIDPCPGDDDSDPQSAERLGTRFQP